MDVPPSSKFESDAEELRTVKMVPMSFRVKANERRSVATRVISANNRVAFASVFAIVGSMVVAFSASLVVVLTRPTHVDPPGLTGASFPVLMDSGGNPVSTAAAEGEVTLSQLPTLSQQISFGGLKSVSLTVAGSLFGATVSGYRWYNRSTMTLYLSTGHVLGIDNRTLTLTAADGSSQVVVDSRRRKLRTQPQGNHYHGSRSHNGGVTYELARPTPSERDSWKERAECDACKWLGDKIKDKVQNEGNGVIAAGLCEGIEDLFDGAADTICAPIVDPLLAPACGWAVGHILDWGCEKLLDWALEKDEEELEEFLGLTSECLCFKMGLCEEDACPDGHMDLPLEPPREDWWECPPAPPAYCQAMDPSYGEGDSGQRYPNAGDLLTEELNYYA